MSDNQFQTEPELLSVPEPIRRIANSDDRKMA